MNPFRPDRSLLDDHVTLSTFDAWAMAAYRASGRNHLGLLAPYVLSGWYDGSADLPLQEAIVDEWPGNVPAEVYCAQAAFGYLGTFSRMSLSSMLLEWPFDAVDLTALRLGAELSESERFVRHVTRLTEAIRYKFEDVCADIHAEQQEHMRVLPNLDREALALAEDGSLEKALSDRAVSSGKLLLVADAKQSEYQAKLEAGIEMQGANELSSWRDSDAKSSNEHIRNLERHVADALGRSVKLAAGGWGVKGGYHLPAPPPWTLAKYDNWELGGGRVEALIVPGKLTGDDGQAWVYTEGSEYRLPKLRIALDAALVSELCVCGVSASGE